MSSADSRVGSCRSSSFARKSYEDVRVIYEGVSWLPPWRRFVSPAPNAYWQLDATEYVLTRGRKCVIFRLIDDHSRYALASHVAWGETAEAAIAVFDKAAASHGVPQRLLPLSGAVARCKPSRPCP